tara:strand:+ start:5669 stop:6439 length:771 start_codon:yes stop_codon:yes gene_type:complete
MKNLIYQYYLPYEAFDADIGGIEMPEWAHSGSRSCQAYAKHCNAEYELNHTRYFEHLDPRLDSLRVIYDPYFDQFDKVLSIDLDMLIATRDNIFDLDIEDVAMVHELGLHTSTSGGWLRKVMDSKLSQRGIIAYGKHLFGPGWMFPRSKLYPKERFRYLNGGLQLWSKVGRLKAREHFKSVDNYVLHTRYTEQMYINLQLSQPIFKVTELDTSWNRNSAYQWKDTPDGKINHFLARAKFTMPKLEQIYHHLLQPRE